MTVVDYSAIDSGLGGPPYPVSVVGVDRVANWSGLDQATYDAKREQWCRAIIAAIDRETAAKRSLSAKSHLHCQLLSLIASCNLFTTKTCRGGGMADAEDSKPS